MPIFNTEDGEIDAVGEAFIASSWSREGIGFFYAIAVQFKFFLLPRLPSLRLGCDQSKQASSYCRLGCSA